MKYIWYPFFCILSLLFTANLSAQNNHFKNYSLAEGLPQSDVVDVVQDPSGYLWFATQGGGIARFDGEHFKVYTQNEGLLSNFANSVLIRNDSLFIGTNNGLSILHKGRFINFKTPKINALLSKGQKLFLATNEGIYAFKKDYVIPLKLTLKIDLSRVENITYNNSFFWIKTTQELWKIDTLYQPKTIQIASKKEVDGYLKNQSIELNKLEVDVSLKSITNTVFRDKQQNTWLLTTGNGIYKSIVTNFSHYQNNIKEVTSVTLANDTLWFTDANQNLFTTDSLGIKQISKLNFKATSITTDSKNNLWFGSENNGIYIYRKEIDSLQNIRFKIERLYRENGFPFNRISAIHIQNDVVWVVTKNAGIVKLEYDFENGFVKNSSLFNANNGVKDLEISFSSLYNNDIWYATKNGDVGTISDNLVSHHSKLLNKNLSISTFSFNKNRVYLGTLGSGIWSADIKFLNQINPLNNSNLSSQNIFQLLFDNEQNLWVGSEKGLDKLLLKNNLISNTTNYNANDGFLGIEASKNTSLKDLTGNLWFGSKNGISKYTPTENQISTTIPTIHFESIRIANQNIDSINQPYDKQFLYLKPTQNYLSFAYKTVDVNQPKRVEYQWKLNNNISSWTSATSIDFGNLDADEYVFSIKSRNAAKIESSSKEFHFMIGKPLHKKTWFILSVFGGIIFIISITIIFYYQRKQKENKAKIEKLTLENHLILLEQKALQLQMNPHFIFNVLNGIKALGNSGNSTELNKTVSQFATLLRSILQNSRKEEISLSEEINTIKNYLELEQRMSSNAFEYVIETATKNTDVDEILIPPMLLQPFVENSIKHGFKGISYVGKIAILFEIKRPFLHCIISDNGIGFNHSKSAENHDSIALKVTKERIGSLSKYSTLDISEIKENDVVKGTKVEFKIPLKTDY